VESNDIASYYRPAERELPELFVGMKKDDVVRNWGRPARIEVAGDPSYQNERWAFYFNGKTKNVYFENGKVQGWELD
jgi:outer membrane protein assembly factor BamE (lipoprotein component of BamABCDE complex)